ncbi:hypothetical protein GYMLUDRAFT_239491 [Collybiopsis luxurians FD-317 M1]|nr:hypothetical protein GYMLUDRAFT_239491 [Collybiopsis luxurians FD-317 M1]
MTIIIAGFKIANEASFEALAIVVSRGMPFLLGPVIPGQVTYFVFEENPQIPQGAMVNAGIKVDNKEVIDTTDTFEYSLDSAEYANFEIGGTATAPTLNFLGVTPRA